MKRMILGLALLLCLALCCACASDVPAPATPAPTSAPTPTPEPTLAPHAHEWSEGVCLVCGERCGHEQWLRGVCMTCGLECRHERHEELSAVCLLCGEQRWHSLRTGSCSGCGRAIEFYTEGVPEDLLAETEHSGQKQTISVEFEEERYWMSVWLPWDYPAAGYYDLLLLVPGDNSSRDALLWEKQRVSGQRVELSRLLDRASQEHLCAPFIAVSLDNEALRDPERGERLLREAVLPYLAHSYGTWAESADAEEIEKAREHFAVLGVSSGSIEVYCAVMNRCPELFGGYACLSNAPRELPLSAKALDEASARDGKEPIYFACWGARDSLAYIEGQRRLFESLVSEAECLRPEETAFSREYEAGHSYDTWAAALWASLQLFF